MLRDAKRVTCPRCGHSFVAFDMEDNATVAPMPVHCPRCGMEIKTGGLPGLLSRLLGLVRKSGTVIFTFTSPGRDFAGESLNMHDHDQDSAHCTRGAGNAPRCTQDFQRRKRRRLGVSL